MENNLNFYMQFSKSHFLRQGCSSGRVLAQHVSDFRNVHILSETKKPVYENF
jgi:hypothetical protein